MINLKPLKTGLLRNSQKIISSDKFVISLTGRRAIIMDCDLNLIAEINKLYYVYSGEISPDEKTLLLISNGNVFYLFSLETFELIRKVFLKGIYNYNLEGRGCFSFDGKHIMIVLSNNKTFKSTLRIYDKDNLDVFDDYLENEYKLKLIFPVKAYSRYLLIGRRECEKDTLIWYDGTCFERYSMPGEVDVIRNIEITHDNRLVIYRGFAEVLVMDFCGNVVDKSIEQMGRFDADLLNTLECNETEISLFEGISAICYSSQLPYCYIGTSNSLIVYSIKEKKIVFRIPIRFGVIELVEITPKLLSVVTFDKQIMFKVICNQ